MESPKTAEAFAQTAKTLMSSALKSIRENAGKAGLTLTPEQEQQLLKEAQEELSNAEPATSTQPRYSPTASQTPMSGESQEQMDIRELFKEYLIPAGGRKRHKHEAELLVDEDNRAVFISEWASAIQSATDIKNLQDILLLGFDVHQVQVLTEKLQQNPTRSSFRRDYATALIPRRSLSLPNDQFITTLLISHQPQQPRSN